MFGKKSKAVKEDAEINIEVSVDNQSDEYQQDFSDELEEDPKGLFRSLRDEFVERTAEDKAFDAAVYKEKQRLAAAREEAKKKNVLRKIKFVDNKISKEEMERDEQVLKQFREIEQSKIDAARAERSSTLVKENKKPITIAAVILLAVCIATGGVSSLRKKAAIANNYDTAVEYIMTEKYDDAFDVLEKMNYQDSEALLDYSELQMLISSYKGNPDEALTDLTGITGIENESVNRQYMTACSEVKKAVGIQADIDKIDISSVEMISKDLVSSITDSKQDLAKRYEVLLDTEKYDIASQVFYNKENNTDAWYLISELNEIGDVTLQSKEDLENLRKIYDNLSDEDKKTILNYENLTLAESKYAELKKAEDERIAAEEKKKAEEQAAKEKEEEEKRQKEEEEQRLAEENETKANYTVYITSGECYHFEGCRYLGSKNKTAVTQRWAINHNYRPCSYCVRGTDIPD